MLTISVELYDVTMPDFCQSLNFIFEALELIGTKLFSPMVMTKKVIRFTTMFLASLRTRNCIKKVSLTTRRETSLSVGGFSHWRKVLENSTLLHLESLLLFKLMILKILLDLLRRSLDKLLIRHFNCFRITTPNLLPNRLLTVILIFLNMLEFFMFSD